MRVSSKVISALCLLGSFLGSPRLWAQESPVDAQLALRSFETLLEAPKLDGAALRDWYQTNFRETAPRLSSYRSVQATFDLGLQELTKRRGADRTMMAGLLLEFVDRVDEARQMSFEENFIAGMDPASNRDFALATMLADKAPLHDELWPKALVPFAKNTEAQVCRALEQHAVPDAGLLRDWIRRSRDLHAEYWAEGSAFPAETIFVLLKAVPRWMHPKLAPELTRLGEALGAHVFSQHLAIRVLVEGEDMLGEEQKDLLAIEMKRWEEKPFADRQLVTFYLEEMLLNPRADAGQRLRAARELQGFGGPSSADVVRNTLRANRAGGLGVAAVEELQKLAVTLAERYPSKVEPATLANFDALFAELNADSWEMRQRATDRLKLVAQPLRAPLRHWLGKYPLTAMTKEQAGRVENVLRFLDEEAQAPERRCRALLHPVAAPR